MFADVVSYCQQIVSTADIMEHSLNLSVVLRIEEKI